MIRGAASAHRRMFERWVADGVDVTIRQYPAPASPAAGAPAPTTVDKVMGRRTALPSVTDEVGPTTTVKAILTNGYAGLARHDPDMPVPVQGIGYLKGVDILLRVRLHDVLVDPARPYGLTLFDTAKDVVFQQSAFEVKATEPAGMPPEGPYELWVALGKRGDV